MPREVLKQNLADVTPVVPLEVAGHAYSVAFGQLQDVNAQRVGLLGVAVDREPLAAARRRASTTLVSGRCWRCCWRSGWRTCWRGA